MGPFAKAFGMIIIGAAHNRKDINKLKDQIQKEGVLLYRGTGLTQQELQTYTDKIGTYDKVALTGFISTSMKRDAAEPFAWSNEDSGHQATLF